MGSRKARNMSVGAPPPNFFIMDGKKGVACPPIKEMDGWVAPKWGIFGGSGTGGRSPKIDLKRVGGRAPPKKNNPQVQT